MAGTPPVYLAILKARRDTASNWTSENPVLQDGELGLETDTRRFKFGNGTSAWTALQYAGEVTAAALTALAALTPTADRVPYYTSSSAAALATLTAFGRSLIDDVDAAAGRTTLGLGTMATQGAGAVAITGGSATLGSLVVSATTPIVEARSSDVSTPFGVRFTSGGTLEGYITQQANIAELVIATGRSVGWTGKIRFVTDTVEKWRMESAGHFRPVADNVYNLGSAAARVKEVFAGTGTINTSDARHKRGWSRVPDEWLDAWADVEWGRFQFRKGERWHVGLVAQKVRDVFARHGLDATEIGLLCYDEWEAEAAIRERRDRDGNVTRPGAPGRRAGNIWGLRYDECQAMEAAYQRRRMTRIEERLDALERAGSKT